MCALADVDWLAALAAACVVALAYLAYLALRDGYPRDGDTPGPP